MVTYSVWLFIRPLSWSTIFPPLAVTSQDKHHLCHWGVLVTELSLVDAQALIQRNTTIRGTENIALGKMYELMRDEYNKNNAHTQSFDLRKLKEQWSTFSAQYIGQTNLTHQRIKNEAVRIVTERPDYSLFEDNCQNFSKYLLEMLCPGATIPDTIQTVLSRLRDLAAIDPMSNQRLPGAYPASASTASSGGTSYVTASGTTWFTAVEYCSTMDSSAGGLTYTARSGRDPTKLSIGLRIAVVARRKWRTDTLLRTAVRNGDSEEVAALLKAGANLSAKDNLGYTALHAAAILGYTEIAEMLVKGGANLSAQCRRGQTPLLLAARTGSNDVLKLLLEYGADVSLQDSEGETALNVAIRKRDYDVVKLSVKTSPLMTRAETNYALLVASTRGHEAVVRLLLDAGAHLNAKGGFYGSALRAASTWGHEAVVRLLLDAGADVNKIEGGGYGGALHGASAKGHESVVRLLLDAGADVNAKGGFWGNALYAASTRGHEAVVRLLLDAGADVNKIERGGSNGGALHAASAEGHESVVRLLLDAGADVNAKGGLWGSALYAASTRGHEAVVRLLLDAGADVNKIERGGSSGGALHAASTRGHGAVVRLLLDARGRSESKGSEL